MIHHVPMCPIVTHRHVDQCTFIFLLLVGDSLLVLILLVSIVFVSAMSLSLYLISYLIQPLS